MNIQSKLVNHNAVEFNTISNKLYQRISENNNNKITSPQSHHNIHPKVVNLSNVNFTHNEITRLEISSKTSHKIINKSVIENIIIETANAIINTDPK